jgi:hypothetical protein
MHRDVDGAAGVPLHVLGEGLDVARVELAVAMELNRSENARTPLGTSGEEELEATKLLAHLEKDEDPEATRLVDQILPYLSRGKVGEPKTAEEVDKDEK